jgi:predicted HAD superfamily hydrolase
MDPYIVVLSLLRRTHYSISYSCYSIVYASSIYFSKKVSKVTANLFKIILNENVLYLAVRLPLHLK